MTLRKREQAVEDPRPFLTLADRTLVSLCREQRNTCPCVRKTRKQSNSDVAGDYTWAKLYQMSIRGLYFSGELSPGS